jgi:glycosyltransferase involved in cell wall biosynthesis
MTDVLSTPPTKPVVEAAGTIAVVITCFNEGAWIEAAARSVLEQTLASRISEIVIVDDGSQAETLAVLDRLEALDPRITVYREKGNRVAKSRNIGVSRTRADWIAFLDGDDFWAPDKLEAQVDCLRRRPELRFCYTGYWHFDNEGVDLAKPVGVVDHSEAKDPVLAYLRASRVSTLAAVDRPLIYKRNHAGSITGDRSRLMMHHAIVAFHFAVIEPRVGPYISARLAERARKLGNLEATDGRARSAQDFYAMSLSFDPWSATTWFLALVHRLGGGGLLARLRDLRRRRR